MSLSRRRFVVLAAVVGFFTKFGRLFAVDSKGVDDELQGLGAWVDTLLPADGLSPAGSELGVDSQILEKAASISQYQQLLSIGLR